MPTIVLLLFLFGAEVATLAQAEDSLYGPTFKGQLHQYAAPAEQQWQESAFELPPYPKPDELRGGELVMPRKDLAYQLDVDSIAIGPDGVTRYAIVITSATRARNVFYEGIRCRTAEYKTYAYGSQGQWSEAANAQWQSVRQIRGSLHRRELFLNYFCDELRDPLTREQVLARIDNPFRFDEGRP